MLRISGDARVRIPYKPFEEDFKTRGKTIELEIATSAVRNYSSTIISCLDKSRTDFYTADTSFVAGETRLKAFDVELNTEKLAKQGITLGSHVINYTNDGWIYEKNIIDLDDWGITLKEKILNIDGTGEDFVYVGDNIIIDYSLQARGFYVTPQVAVFKSQQSTLSSQYKEEEHVRLTFVIERNTANRIIWMYIDGIASGAVQYPVDDSFRQLDSDIIELGSNDAVLDIYNIRIYDNSLNSRQVVNNWVADTQDASLRVQRYSRNNNYNDKNEIIISQLPADLPYIIWDIQPLPEYKGDKRLGNARYVDPANPERSFTAKRAQYNVQGTSSSVYPIKNIRTKYKAKDNDPLFAWYNDNGDTIKKFPITYPNGIGVNYFTFKVDYASSEGANNVELVKLYNEAALAAGIYTPPQKAELLSVGGDYTQVRTRVGIDGFPIVAFHQDADGNVKFCTKANFNNDKANEDVYGFAEGDESWEITNNSAAEGKFQVPITEENFSNGLEIRFPDEDGYNNMDKLGPMSAWLASTYRANATNETFAAPVTFEYEETTKAEDGTFSKTKVTKTFDADTEEYRLTKFKAELKDWFSVESTIFYYIFTLLFLMIDSRAKNAFPTYFKSRTAGDGGDRWFWLPYDMDTAIGIDNKGKLSFDYYLEDFDKLDGANVYNGQDSVIWTNLRDAFAGEIAEMYAELRTQRLIDYNHVEQLFEEHQNKWTESIFNEDAAIKYVAPLAKGDNYLEMLQGSKAQQRKWWLFNRFKYMDSKFNAGDAKADFIQFRAYVDAGIEKPNITITPYADIYATVSFANSAVGTKSKRAKRNEPIIIENPFKTDETETDQETYIYSASQLKSIGDLSPFHPDTVKVGNAVKLQDLKIGDKDPTYVNPYLTELTLGSNTLLKTLDVRNCINLTQAIDISKCTNIEEIYFDGTKITGITLPDGGNIKKLHLPETLTKLTIKNQPLLTELQLDGTSNIESLWLENIPSTSIDAHSLVAQMKYNSAIRIIGMDERYDTWEELAEFYSLLDKMSGLDYEGITTKKAQVTGKIYVPHIPYAEFTEMSARYPEITILTDAVVCSVTFKNEGEIVNEQRVNQGFTAYLPEEPTKQSTQKNYYVFDKWVTDSGLEWHPEDIITMDLTIIATYIEYVQQYTVTYEPDSNIITCDKTTETVYYGSSLVEPVCTGIPEGVRLIGWFTPEDTLWSFDEEYPSLVTDHIVLTAKWEDSNLPALQVRRTAFNTFVYEAWDNLGISDFALVHNSEAEPETWEHTTPETYKTGFGQITAAGEYYFWVADKNGNKAKAKLIAFELSKKPGTGIDDIEFFEQDNIIDDFALEDTDVNVNVVLNSHYENLSITLNGEAFTNGSNIVVIKDIEVEAVCTPKSYTVSFVTNKESDNVFIESQTIAYLHKVQCPLPPYHAGYIIDKWYTEPECLNEWLFDTMVVEDDTTLYATWREYRTPTKIIVTIPYDLADLEDRPNDSSSFDPYTVEVYFTQNRTNDVKVFFGDDTGEFSSDQTTYVTSIRHTYIEPGDYTIEIYGTPHGYQLGGSFDKQTVDPACCIKAVDFAWDVVTTRDYAFRGAHIEQLNLTPYMTSIAASAFALCRNLKELKIPSSIKHIGPQAFENCSGLVGDLIIPKTLETVGNNAFSRCTNLNRIIFEESGKLTEISNHFADACGITEVVVPKHIEFIGAEAFMNCGKLQKVVLMNPNLKVGERIFNSTVRLLSAGPIDYDLGPGNHPDFDIEFAWTTEIPPYAFAAATGFAQSYMTSVTLPDTLVTIGDSAFKGTVALKNIKIPASVRTIGNEAFYYSGLLELDVPKTVTSIGDRAFCRNASLNSVTLRLGGSYNTADTAEEGWFLNCRQDLVIKIPPELAADYDYLHAQYGPYWAVYKIDDVTGAEYYLDYIGLPE